MKIGIGIVTRNRQSTLAWSMGHHYRHTPSDFKTVIVDDASTDIQPLDVTYRFDTQVGVARATNKCLELLEDCDHIFIFNDDTYPINDGWWQPYVNHDEPHLLYQFKLPGKPASDMQEVYRDEDTVAYTHTRGAMIYVERRVLDVVGGFDTEYFNSYEHPDFTNRIHNAGLTTHRAMDVPNSDQLLYCLDQDSKVESSIKKDKKQDLKNFRHYQSQKNSKEYKEFRS